MRYVGCSNYPAWQLALALGTSALHGLARYDCLQPRYNVLHRDIETELLPLCRDQGIGVIVYNPLAGGFLTGKHRGDAPPAPGTRFTLGAAGELYRDRYWHAAQFEAVAGLKAFCAERALNLATASVAWVARPARHHLGDRRRQPAGAARSHSRRRRHDSRRRDQEPPSMPPGGRFPGARQPAKGDHETASSLRA